MYEAKTGPHNVSDVNLGRDSAADLNPTRVHLRSGARFRLHDESPLDGVQSTGTPPFRLNRFASYQITVVQDRDGAQHTAAQFNTVP